MEVEERLKQLKDQVAKFQEEIERLESLPKVEITNRVTKPFDRDFYDVYAGSAYGELEGLGLSVMEGKANGRYGVFIFIPNSDRYHRRLQKLIN